MVRDLKGKVMNEILVKTVLVSVSDKSGLELLVPGIINCSRGVRFISTGGTFRRVLDIQQLTGQFRELAEGKNYKYLLPEK